MRFNVIPRAVFILHFVVFAIMLTSCYVRRPPYPSNWPVISKNQEPSAFNGYFARGIDTLVEGGFIKTSTESRDSLYLQVKEDLTIWLASKDSSIGHPSSIKKYPSATNSQRVTIRKVPQGLLLRYHLNNTAGSMLLGPDRIYSRLSMLSDGSLLIKKGEWYAGLVMLIFPVYGTEYQWIRVTSSKIEMIEYVKKSNRGIN